MMIDMQAHAYRNATAGRTYETAEELLARVTSAHNGDSKRAGGRAGGGRRSSSRLYSRNWWRR
jgi:hypothetical protein